MAVNDHFSHAMYIPRDKTALVRDFFRAHYGNKYIVNLRAYQEPFDEVSMGLAIKDSGFQLSGERVKILFDKENLKNYVRKIIQNCVKILNDEDALQHHSKPGLKRSQLLKLLTSKDLAPVNFNVCVDVYNNLATRLERRRRKDLDIEHFRVPRLFKSLEHDETELDVVTLLEAIRILLFHEWSQDD